MRRGVSILFPFRSPRPNASPERRRGRLPLGSCARDRPLKRASRRFHSHVHCATRGRRGLASRILTRAQGLFPGVARHNRQALHFPLAANEFAVEQSRGGGDVGKPRPAPAASHSPDAGSAAAAGGGVGKHRVQVLQQRRRADRRKARVVLHPLLDLVQRPRSAVGPASIRRALTDIWGRCVRMSRSPTGVRCRQGYVTRQRLHPHALLLPALPSPNAPQAGKRAFGSCSLGTAP